MRGEGSNEGNERVTRLLFPSIWSRNGAGGNSLKFQCVKLALSGFCGNGLKFQFVLAVNLTLSGVCRRAKCIFSLSALIF